MTGRDDHQPGTDLREQVEKRTGRFPQDPDNMTADDVRKLIHELQVHQVELEMQNDELRRIQWDLDEERRKYADLYEFAPVGYFTSDVLGGVLDSNSTMLSLLGLERHKLIGQRFVLYINHLTVPVYHEHCQRLASTKTKQVCDLKLTRSDGNYFDARLESISMESNTGLLFRNAVTDITDYTRANTALRDSEERLRMAIQRSPMLLYHHDSNLRYTWMHDPYPGLNSEQVIGKHDEELFVLEEAVPLTRFKQEVLDTGRPARHVFPLTVGGQVRYYDISVERLGGPSPGISCAAVDVTGRRRQDEIIQRQNEEMEDFLYILAHDLKSPVVSLQGLLGVLREEKEPMLDKDGCKILDYCTVECNRMTDIVAQVREMGRIKQTNVVHEETNLHDFVDSLLQRFETQFKEKGIQTKVKCADIDVVFARAQVDQAVHNLIDNALKYGLSGQNPELTITCQPAGDSTRITVEDNGPGISPVHHQQVFKLFRRLDPHGQIKGSGVGLTSVQSLMRRIGGEVSLESDMGNGARFTISFPSQVVSST